MRCFAEPPATREPPNACRTLKRRPHQALSYLTPIEFYRVEVDTSQRMLRADDLYNDFQLLMELLGLKA